MPKYNAKFIVAKKEKYTYGVLIPFEEKYHVSQLESAFLNKAKFWRLECTDKDSVNSDKEAENLIKDRGLDLVTIDDFNTIISFVTLFPSMFAFNTLYSNRNNHNNKHRVENIIQS